MAGEEIECAGFSTAGARSGETVREKKGIRVRMEEAGCGEDRVHVWTEKGEENDGIDELRRLSNGGRVGDARRKKEEGRRGLGADGWGLLGSERGRRERQVGWASGENKTGWGNWVSAQNEKKVIFNTF